MEKNVNFVRNAGLLETYFITNHKLPFSDSCVVTAAKYSFLDYRLDKTILFPALHRVIETHGALGVRLVGASTRRPAFQRLQSVDLTKVVHYSHQGGDSLQQVLEIHAMHLFDTDAELPLWGLTVLTDNTVLFFWHHCIGDGMSSLAFHRSLLAALNADNTIYDGQESVDIPSTASIVPAIESLVDVRPSISQFYSKALTLLAPASWTSARSAWTGNPVKESRCRPELRLLEFSPEETTRFVACCRKNRATLTPALYILAVSALSRVLRAQTKPTMSQSWKSVSTLIPISLRPVARTSPDVICNHVTQYPTYTILTPEFSWSTASKLTSALYSFRRKAAGEVGMLRYIFGQFEAFWKAKFGRKREAGFEISSIGRFSPSGCAHADTEKWHIDRVIFAQSDLLTGAAIKLNVCGNPLGGMAIAVAWSLDTVEPALAEAFVSTLKQMFREIIVEGDKH